MGSVSSFIIHGNLGNNWQQKTEKMAVNTIFVNNKEKQEMFYITAFNTIADNLSRYTKKGQEVVLKCQLKPFFNQDSKYNLSIIVRGFDFCGKKSDEINNDLLIDQNEIKGLWD